MVTRFGKDRGREGGVVFLVRVQEVRCRDKIWGNVECFLVPKSAYKDA